jgi:DNA repair exonuclease SbcCD nuclease subunit
MPVLLVPGNHERSTLPLDLLHQHENIHCFFHPRTVTLSLKGMDIAFAGFPFVRHHIRELFSQILQETGWNQPAADFRFLCMHHAVEGATVGVQNFVFHRRDDTIRCHDLPKGLDAVLSGHIHRHQVLNCDLQGKPLYTPVIYPGAIERTSVAERLEEKGFVVLELEINRKNRKDLRRRFCPLPARPMFLFEFDGEQSNLKRKIEKHLYGLPCNAVVHIRIKHLLSSQPGINTALLRGMVPPSVNITLTMT